MTGESMTKYGLVSLALELPPHAPLFVRCFK